MIEVGADVNQARDDGVISLYIARALMEAGADVNQARDDGATPLFVAAQEGLEAVARALMEAGADVNQLIHHSLPGSLITGLTRVRTRRYFFFRDDVRGEVVGHSAQSARTRGRSRRAAFRSLSDSTRASAARPVSHLALSRAPWFDLLMPS